MLNSKLSNIFIYYTLGAPSHELKNTFAQQQRRDRTPEDLDTTYWLQNDLVTQYVPFQILVDFYMLFY